MRTEEGLEKIASSRSLDGSFKGQHPQHHHDSLKKGPSRWLRRDRSRSKLGVDIGTSDAVLVKRPSFLSRLFNPTNGTQQQRVVSLSDTFVTASSTSVTSTDDSVLAMMDTSARDTVGHHNSTSHSSNSDDVSLRGRSSVSLSGKFQSAQSCSADVLIADSNDALDSNRHNNHRRALSSSAHSYVEGADGPPIACRPNYDESNGSESVQLSFQVQFKNMRKKVISNSSNVSNSQKTKTNEKPPPPSAVDPEPEAVLSAAELRAVQHYEAALRCAHTQALTQAYEEVAYGILLLETSKPLYWKLLQFKAEILGRMRDYHAALLVYERLLERAQEEEEARAAADGEEHDVSYSMGTNNTTTNASRSSNVSQKVAEVANLAYACGRLCFHLRLFPEAIRYYTLELEYTRAVSRSENMAVARIYHELAKVAQACGELPDALGYYEQALVVEQIVLQNALTGSSCPDCSRASAHHGASQRHKNAVDHSTHTNAREGATKTAGVCHVHAVAIQDIAQQVMETKRCIGKIHFAQGDLDQAMRLSMRSIS